MSGKSGLQREVLALYRRYVLSFSMPQRGDHVHISAQRALRMVNTKPPPTRAKFLLLVRYTFRANASSVSPRDVSVIEHLMRKGTRQLEMYEDHGVKECWVSEEMLLWDETRKAHSTRWRPDSLR